MSIKCGANSAGIQQAVLPRAVQTSMWLALANDLLIKLPLIDSVLDAVCNVFYLIPQHNDVIFRDRSGVIVTASRGAHSRDHRTCVRSPHGQLSARASIYCYWPVMQFAESIRGRKDTSSIRSRDTEFVVGEEHRLWMKWDMKDRSTVLQHY
ncbi:unnamed protein product [Colias eurytheme]|nr:unnamed protein product [Colias eurytheme]